MQVKSKVVLHQCWLNVYHLKNDIISSALLKWEWWENQNTRKHSSALAMLTRHDTLESRKPWKDSLTHLITSLSISLSSLIACHLAALGYNLRHINTLSQYIQHRRVTSDKSEALCELFKQTEGLKSFSSHHKKASVLSWKKRVL